MLRSNIKILFPISLARRPYIINMTLKVSDIIYPQIVKSCFLIGACDWKDATFRSPNVDLHNVQAGGPKHSMFPIKSSNCNYYSLSKYWGYEQYFT